MLRPLIHTLVTGLLAALLGAGLGVGTAAPAGASVREPAVEFDTDLTLVVPRCEDCVITLYSYNGLSPIYSSAPETVVDNRVTITLPSARTAGMSVRVEAPWSDLRSETYVAWRYAGTEIGDVVRFKQARSKTSASGCWAGTVNEAVTLKVKVRRVMQGGRPAALAWAPVTESFVDPMLTARRGVLTSGDVLACDLG